MINSSHQIMSQRRPFSNDCENLNPKSTQSYINFQQDWSLYKHLFSQIEYRNIVDGLSDKLPMQ